MAKSGAAMYDSMLQGLQQILSELGALMAAPDADHQFLATLQKVIVMKIKQGTQQAVSGGGPGGGGPGGPPPNQIGPGGGAGMGGLVNQDALQAQGAMGGAPGGAPAMTNPDEMRRMVGATGATG